MYLRHHYGKLLAVGLLLLSILLGANAKPYKVGSAFLDKQGEVTRAYSLYTAGLQRPVQLASGIVQYTHTGTNIKAGSGYSVFSYFSKKDAMAMFGPAGTRLVWDIYRHSADVRAMEFVAFGPFAQTVDVKESTSFFTYFPQILWTMPNEPAQAVGLLVTLAERDLFPIRQVLYRGHIFSIGTAAEGLYRLIAPRFSCRISYYVSESKFDLYQYNGALLDNRPGIVYLYGMTEGHPATEEWYSNIVVSPTLNSLNASVATTFEQQYSLLAAYNRRSSGHSRLLPAGNILMSSPVPGAGAKEYAASSDFLSGGPSWYEKLFHSEQSYLMAGWVSGMALMQSLNKYTGRYVGNSMSFFYRMSLNQNSYVVSDLFIGTFGEPQDQCSAVAAKQGILCNCHFAGNNIWFHTFVKAQSAYDTAPVRGKLYQYALNNCARLSPPKVYDPSVIPFDQLVRTSVPIHVAGFAPTDDAMMETMCRQTHDVISRVSNVDLYHHVSTHAYRGYCIPSTVSNMSTKLSVHTNDYVMTSMMGVIPETVSAPAAMVLDYIPRTTQPRKSQANLVYLFPTLDQELYVLASYLSGVVSRDSMICSAVRQTSASKSIHSLLQNSLATFGLVLGAVFDVPPTSTLMSRVAPRCTHTFAIGFDHQDGAGVVSYLKSNQKSVVFASFDDLTKYYSSLTPALDDAAADVTDRFVFATNLPPWTGIRSNPSAAAASAPLKTVEQFLQSVPTELQTPAAIRAYIVAMIYDQLTAGSDPETGDMQKMLYTNTSWEAGGLAFGPYSTQCIMDMAYSENSCVHNFGAREISVWSYTRVVIPGTDVLVQAVTPSMVYNIPLPKARLMVPTVSGNVSAAGMCLGMATASNASVVDVATTDGTAATQGINGTNELLMSSDMPSCHSSSDDSTLDALLMICSMCVCATAVVVVLLLLVKLGMLWRGLLAPDGGNTLCGGNDGLAVLRAREGQLSEDFFLQHSAQDVSRVPAVDGGHPLTFVCVSVAEYHAMWTHAPEVMARAVTDYQQYVRKSIVRHGCYEADTVDGLFLIACGSADTGLSVALDCAAAFRSGTQNAAAVNAAYAAVGSWSSAPTDSGLRLRIAVHCGAASACFTDGRVRWSGGAVNDVISAACNSNTAWQVVVTESVRCALVEMKEVHLESLHPMKHANAGPSELFVVQQSGTDTVLLDHELHGEDYHVVERDLECEGAVTSALCRHHLEAFLLRCCGDHGDTYLAVLAHCLGLPAVSRDCYTDTHAYAAALLPTVCGRLGALLECRHKRWNECGVKNSTLGVSNSSPAKL